MTKKPDAPEEIFEEADLEECAKENKRPPLARKYRFKVNDTLCVWESPSILGREILTAAGLTPPENYSLREKMRDGTPRRIELDERVDLRKPGVEKFRAIRRDQTEG